MQNYQIRSTMERAITRRIIKSIFELGYTLSVFDGEEDWDVIAYIPDRKAFIEKTEKILRSMDDETIAIYVDGKRRGSIYLVYGNDGYDVICDHTDSDIINNLLKKTDALANWLDERAFKYNYADRA